MLTGKGSPRAALDNSEIRNIVASGTPEELYVGKRVLVLTPDTTRTCPLPLMVKLLQEIVGAKAKTLDFMVALGTHQPLSEDRILELYGISESDRKTTFSKTKLHNHRWDLEGTFRRVGYLSKEDTRELSGGRLVEKVPVDINKTIFEYDQILILGPVFPHEVVGYSGGAKYLFPGISGGEFLHFFHWLGAVVTCPGTIGIKHTPVREVINRAMKLIDVPVHCISMVVKSSEELYGIYAGGYVESWESAANLSEQIHVVFKEKAFDTVLGVCPEMYNELWTGGKVMYKLEQVVAPGGKLIIYAPHITEVSRTWGTYMDKIGYHTVDYFLEQPEKFTDIPRGVLAHSTHVRGIGKMEQGVEKPRIEVILASSLSQEECTKINLGYMDYREIDLEMYKDREDEGVLFVDRAGEVLHRVKS
ncbi:MAG: nickel-dependent lactate racemase [Desulforhopalus sp.]|jgi:nickel-dependent lactate racemase